MKSALLKMPRLGETMEEGRIAGWMVKVGESFKRGQSILEVETDKTIVEFPALGTGVLEEILAVEGDVISVGDVIGRIDFVDGNDWITENVSEAADFASSKKEAEAIRGSHVLETYDAPRSMNVGIRATPVARKLARQKNVNLQNVPGTGRRDRIESTDIRSIQPAGVDIQVLENIAHVDTGPDNATSVLLIHGFAGDHSAFTGLSNQLSRTGIRSLSIDLPGHGATELDADTTDELSSNLKEFVSQISGKNKFHIVAHSLGALPAISLADNFDIASLTLIAPAGIGAYIDVEFIEKMSSPSSVEEVSDMLARLTAQPVSLSRSAIEALYKVLAKGRLRNLKNSFTKRGKQTIDIRPALENISRNIPVNIAIGHQDKIINWQDALTLSPLIDVHHFIRSGHMPHWDQQPEFVDLLVGIVQD